MKGFLVCQLCLLSFMTFSQTTTDDKPFKGFSKIILECDSSGSVLYRQFGNYLVAQGYQIENSSPDFLTLSTRQQRGKFVHEVAYSISISIKGNVATLTALQENGMKQWSYHPGWQVNRDIFRDFQQVAKGFKANKTTYSN